jgi:hypothetical protein
MAYSRLSKFSAIRRLLPLPVTGLHLWLLVVSVLLRITPAATRDLGLYSLVQKIRPHVQQQDSNPRRKVARSLRYRSNHCTTRETTNMPMINFHM